MAEPQLTHISFIAFTYTFLQRIELQILIGSGALLLFTNIIKGGRLMSVYKNLLAQKKKEGQQRCFQPCLHHYVQIKYRSLNCHSYV